MNKAVDAVAGGWTAGDLEALRGATAVLCADCVYDDELTDALWATLFALFGHCPRLRAAYVAAERRINFSAEDFTGACAASCCAASVVLACLL